MNRDIKQIAFQCPKIKENVKINEQYKNISKEDIAKGLVETLMNIMKSRENSLDRFLSTEELDIKDD